MSGKDVSVVLAVDDDPDARALLDRALSAAGFAMVFAHDGEAALTLLEDMTPDLILLDAVMPPPDGFETCRRIKAHPLLGALSGMFMTGLSDTRSEERRAGKERVRSCRHLRSPVASQIKYTQLSTTHTTTS